MNRRSDPRRMPPYCHFARPDPAAPPHNALQWCARAGVGAVLLLLTLFLGVVFDAIQSADKGFWWPLLIWLQR